MPIDLTLFSGKLQKYRGQFELSLEELSRGTGIPLDTLAALEAASVPPSGDQILILADFFRCDYKFFISNERLAPFEQTETLFRRHGDQIKKHDRWAIQEFLFLAEAESFLQEVLGRKPANIFAFQKQGNYLKGQAADAAERLRAFLGYSNLHVPQDVYGDFRKMGLHVFRRPLENSSISGLFVRHPTAGKCILVNYNEDVYRQRFTAAHEAAHAILDDQEEVVISFKNGKEPQEVRANTFASRYLLPPEALKRLPAPRTWKSEDVILWANKLMVSTTALAFALSDADVIDRNQMESIRKTRIPTTQKSDPEFPPSLSAKSTQRRHWIIEHGLSTYYVSLGFEAYRQGILSAERLRELLLLDSDSELQEIAILYGERLDHGN